MLNATNSILSLNVHTCAKIQFSALSILFIIYYPVALFSLKANLRPITNKMKEGKRKENIISLSSQKCLT